jgi:hypothetical protein
MSHVVLAQRSVDGLTVERIQDVLSVDVVVKPATTTSLCESATDATGGAERANGGEGSQACDEQAAGPDDSVPTKVDTGSTAVIAALLERLERIAERWEQGCGCSQGCGAARGTIAQERAEGSREAPSSPAAVHTRDSPTVSELLGDSDLPEFAVTESFRNELEAADEPRRRALIADRRELLERAGRRVRSVERGAESHRPGSVNSFVRAVRGR